MTTLSYRLGQALPTSVPLTWKVRGSNSAGNGVWSKNVAFVVVPDHPSLTITANDQSKTYGDALSLGSSAFTTAGLLPGDSVASVTLSSAGAAAAAAVSGSPYAIVPSAASGTGLDKYAITYCERQPDGRQARRSRSAARSPRTSSSTAPRRRPSTSPAPASSGVIGGDAVTIDSSGCSASFDSASVGAGKPVDRHRGHPRRR